MPTKSKDISKALEDIRNSGEFTNEKIPEQTNQLSNFFDQLAEKISDLQDAFNDWLKDLFPQVDIPDTPFGGELVDIIGWCLLILGILFLLFILYKLLIYYRKTETEEFKTIINLDSGKLDSNSWFDLAMQSAKQAKYREACRGVYMSIIFYLDEKGVIKYDNAKTNIEYLQTVRSKKELYNSLKDVVDVFEYTWYGKNPGTEEDYDKCVAQMKNISDE